MSYMALLYTSVPDSNSDGDPKRESSDTMGHNDCLPCEATDLEFAQSM
jgi:hypothetical protein